MSKLGCICGNQIVDQTDDLPYKGEIVSDQDVEHVYFDGIIHDVNGFLEAVLAGHRDEWVREYFSSEYPQLDNASIISDIVMGNLFNHKRTIYQCAQCGRIYIQDDTGVNTFTVFAADNWPEGRQSILAATGKD